MHSSLPFVIAIDGPAASGKGAVSRMLASHYNFQYLDTGKLYRAVGKFILDNHPSLIETPKADADYNLLVEVASSVAQSDSFILNSSELNTEEIGRAASIVSAIPEVRESLLLYQRQFATQSDGAILDGRDIGTVIFPDADIKFFITASLPARAQRRTKQLHGEGKTVKYANVLTDLESRDRRDSERSAAPLVKAEDAILIDSTEMNLQDVFKCCVSEVDNALKA